MALKIKASSLIEQCYLEVSGSGVKYCKTAFAGGVKRFAFDQIDVILMAPDKMLSFQVGKEVFSLRTKPSNRKHRQVIDTLVQEVKRAHGEV